MDEENAIVLRPLLDLVTDPNQTQFQLQFRQAGSAILLGRPHSEGYEDFVQTTFHNEGLNHQNGYPVAANVCQGMLVVTVQKNNRRINNFAIQVRFDNQIFGLRNNVNFEFKEAVSKALWKLKDDFNYSKNVLGDNIAWAIGRPLS